VTAGLPEDQQIRPRYRSAWIVPGLALVWLALVATLTQSVATTAYVLLMTATLLLLFRAARGDRRARETTTPAPPPSQPTQVTNLSDQQILTAEEVAAMLRFTVPEIITAVQQGTFQGNQLNGQWRVTSESVSRWLQASP
jgi:hypothetical protein